MKDKFVPQRSSLDPFFFDEKEIVPGTHTKMTKPDSAQDLRYLVLRNRLLRNAPNKAEREIIQGASRESVEGINRVRGAAHLCDVEDLMAQAVDLLKEPAALPLVERALGLALLDNEVYSQAAELLKRYVDFEMPGGGGHPFSTDAQALQQLAIALSGAGNIRDAVTRLEALDPQLRSDPETLGILGGRFKRQWLKTETKPQIGYRALDLYRKALALARADELPNQIYYNGINVAYLLFALGEDGYQPLTEEVLAICELLSEPDYWSDATRGECFLLLRRYPEAREAYNAAARRQHESRHWTSTGQQALDILKRQGDPQEAAAVAALFQRIRPDFRPSGSVGG
jgi:tetratricopeptide (TPR) repeat protein